MANCAAKKYFLITGTQETLDSYLKKDTRRL
jgi:hypothetical protein